MQPELKPLEYLDLPPESANGAQISLDQAAKPPGQTDLTMTDKLSYQGESATTQNFDTEGVRRADGLVRRVRPT
jgi:hypothetical protein